MTSEQQEQLDTLDAFHANAKAIILHGGGPEGAQRAGFNVVQFFKNFYKVVQFVWPIVKPFIPGVGTIPLPNLPDLPADPVAPDPALPAKA